MVFQDETVVGRILEILKAEHALLVLVDEFQICTERHTVFGMPVLRRQQNEEKFILVRAEVCFNLHVFLAFIIWQKP